MEVPQVRIRIPRVLRRTSPVWQPLVYLIAAFFIMSVCAGLISKILLKNTLHLHEKLSLGYFMTASEIVMAFSALFALGITTRHKDGSFFAKTAFVTDVPHFALFWKGCAIGAICLSIPVMLMAIPGWYHASLSDMHDIVVSLIEGAVCMIFVGIFEETMFRGIFFEFVEQSMGTWAALAITSICFGLVHIINPAATLFGALCISVEAGLMIGGALVYTRSMWSPIGIHAAWNLFQGSVWGLAVSGSPKPARSVFASTMIGGPWFLTGGTFGPEASLFSLVVCSAVGIYFIRHALEEGKFYPPAWNTKEYKLLQYETCDGVSDVEVGDSEKAPLLSN